SSGGGADYTACGFSDLIGGDFIVGDNGRTCREIVDKFAPPKFFASIRERRRLSSTVEETNSLQNARDEELKSLKAQLLVKKAEAAETIRLHAEASKFEVVERSLQDEVKVREQEVADLDAQVTFSKCLSDNFADWVHELEASFAGLHEKMALHFEEKFYPRLLTTIFGCQWLLTHDIELAIAKCLNSTEYLSTLGAAIGKAIEKANYLSALQRLQSVKFSLIAELRANKDASIDTIINLLRLEDTLAERLGLTESQPHVNQLMVPIHHSLDQRVIGASALSLSLDVSISRVRKIKENIANHMSALRDVFVPLSEPLSAVALEGTKGISSGAPGTTDTTTTLSIVVASTNIVRPISIDDYKVSGSDDQATADRNVADKDVNPFPNVDDAELNVLE
ncbi:hypothetical protein Tco_1306456, partial [Tanacetum coccineum]